MKVKFKVVSDTISDKIKQMISKGKNTKPLFAKIAKDMEKETQMRFENKKDPDGKRWKPLSDNTIASRMMINKNGKLRKKANTKYNPKAGILTNSGRLKNSIKSDSGELGAKVSTSNEYARTHQYGAKNRVIIPATRKDSSKNKNFLFFYTVKGFRLAKKVRVTIPARPFMGLSKKQIVRYNKMILKYIFK